MNFQKKLDLIIKKNNSLLCIGLDTDSFYFNKKIIDQTCDLVCAYKPNSAFYEASGIEGIKQLKKTCDYLTNKYPNIPIILDAKRGDIGNTNRAYAKYIFDFLRADAVTLNPYLGKEALLPFLEMEDKGCIILCRTSNSGAGEFQDLMVDGKPLYKVVAKKVVGEWNKNKNCLLVVGATYPKELSEIRQIAGDMSLLIPGIGAQGGDMKKTVKAGVNSKGAGIIISVSRSIIYTDNPKEEAKKLRNEINNYRNN